MDSRFFELRMSRGLVPVLPLRKESLVEDVSGVLGTLESVGGRGAVFHGAGMPWP